MGKKSKKPQLYTTARDIKVKIKNMGPNKRRKSKRLGYWSGIRKVFRIISC